MGRDATASRAAGYSPASAVTGCPYAKSHVNKVLIDLLSGKVEMLLDTQEEKTMARTFSPDGTYFLYARTTAARGFDIFWQRVGGGNPRNLTEDSAAYDGQPAISPDGQRIAFRSEREGGGIFVMGATGESVRRVTDFGYNPAWSPDGKQIAVATEGVVEPGSRTSTSRIFRVDLATGQRRLVSRGDAVQPSWSPDGRRVVALRGSARAYNEALSGGVPGGIEDIVWVPAAGGDAGASGQLARIAGHGLGRRGRRARLRLSSHLAVAKVARRQFDHIRHSLETPIRKRRVSPLHR